MSQNEEDSKPNPQEGLTSNEVDLPPASASVEADEQRAELLKAVPKAEELWRNVAVSRRLWLIATCMWIDSHLAQRRGKASMSFPAKL